MSTYLDSPLATPAEIAAQLHRIRDAVLSLQGREKFDRHVEACRPTLQAICDAKQLTQIQSTLEILKTMQANDVASLLVLAACVEIMEPTS